MKITSHNPKKYTKEGNEMIVMNIEIDNFFAFKNFKMNMSYPKKILGSYIEGEYLRERENFRYKKVNILMGANATGKTSFGKMLMAIFNFMKKKDYKTLLDHVCDKGEKATIVMDFVAETNTLYRINIEVKPDDSGNKDISLTCLVRSVEINKKDSYETCAKRIEAIPVEMKTDVNSELEKIEAIGWMFIYPTSDDKASCLDDPIYPQILDYTLRALDPSILRVEKLENVEDSYVVRMQSQDLIIQDGEVIKGNILSSGTKDGIAIAKMIAAMYCGDYGFYYCDERFAYVNSNAEKAFLSTMINQIKDNQQFFFTTHNLDILDLPLPKHTFSFMKKDTYDENEPIKCVCVSDFLKRNTDSVRNAVENDLFSAAPDLELVYKIAEL